MNQQDGIKGLPQTSELSDLRLKLGINGNATMDVPHEV